MIIEIDIERLVREEVSRQLKEREDLARECGEPETCVGQKALAAKLHVCLITVNRWHKEGRLDGCYTRVGRKIVYNLSKIEKLYQKF